VVEYFYMSNKDSAPLPPLYGLETGQISELPTELQANLDQRLLMRFRFADTPHNLAIWSYVANAARKEDAAHTPQPETLRTVSSESLLDFVDSVIKAPASERYDLTLQSAPNGQQWYDILYGFHSQGGAEAIAATLSLLRYSRDKQLFQTAADLGAGTGKTTNLFAGHAEQIVGVDRNRTMLRQAKQNVPVADFVQARVDRLPLDDNSVDVMTGEGVKYSLEHTVAVHMYREIGRVLKPGGTYIDSDYKNPSDIVINKQGKAESPDYHPEDLGSFVTWKALLQDMIVDTVSGKHSVLHLLNTTGDMWESTLAENNLHEDFLSIPSWTSSVRLLTKVS
jgi:ubiquinone/menaquinone biosynthesis C-methylase UbiE